jgi:23S rRNA (guanosine2251-2'-O)-methyltransferase
MTDWVVGYHAVVGALESGRPVEQVWLQQGRRDQRLLKLRQLAQERGVVSRWVSRRRLDELAQGAPHNGCAARCGEVPLVGLDELMKSGDAPGRLLLLDDLTDPHNLGAAIRSAAAFGIDGVIVAGPSAPPLGGAAARAAAGLMGRVPIVRSNVAADALVGLKDAGYWAFGADSAGVPVAEVRPTDRWVLCIGSEERGLRAKTRSQIDELVRIPIDPEIESLNLAVATGILLYHLCRLWPSQDR